MGKKSLKKEIVTLDKATLKGKDIAFAREVVIFLKNHEQNYSIEGGFVRELEKGLVRCYQDIDLRIISPKGNLKEFNNYVTAIRELYGASKGDQKINNWEVEDISEQFAKYVGVDVKYRFRVRSPETRTSIDFTFGKHDRDEVGDLRGEKDIHTPMSCIPLMILAKKPGSRKKRK